jgi:hypothetical protein
MIAGTHYAKSIGFTVYARRGGSKGMNAITSERHLDDIYIPCGNTLPHLEAMAG